MSNPNPELEGVMRRVEKLLAIAQDDRANPNEAAAAASMAEKIMRKYQLEHSDIIISKLKAGEDLDTTDCIATAKTNGTKVKAVPLWANYLATQLAEFNEVGARISHNKQGEAIVRFFGFQSDVQVTKYMFDYLVAAVNRLVDTFKQTDPSYQVWGRKAANSYRQGVALGICSQLKKATVEKAKEMATAAGTSLVVAKKQAIAERWTNVFETKTSRSSVARGSAFSSGVADGKLVDVNRRGVGNNASDTKLLG